MAINLQSAYTTLNILIMHGFYNNRNFHGTFYTRTGGLFYIVRFNGDMCVVNGDIDNPTDDDVEPLSLDDFINREPVYVTISEENNVPATDFYNMAINSVHVWGNQNDIPIIDENMGADDQNQQIG